MLQSLPLLVVLECSVHSQCSCWSQPPWLLLRDPGFQVGSGHTDSLFVPFPHLTVKFLSG